MSRRDKSGEKNPNWKGGGAEIVCEQCATRFHVLHPRIHTARFCSMKCANDWQKVHPYLGARVQRVEVECRECCQLFYILPSQVKLRFFCSTTCHFRWRSRRHSGASNPNWNGGTRSEKYPPEFFAIRRSILARDGYQCAVPFCITNDPRVHVHHIDFNKSNCAPENLITACPSCNARANFDRVLWKAVLSNVVKWRMDNGAMNIGFRGSMIHHRNRHQVTTI